KFFIIIEEIPYQLNKASLIERIANLVKEKKITGIVDLRDESNREGIRVVIELKKGEEPELVLNKLYKYTELQSTFGVIMLALVNNVPKILTLKQMLSEYIGHRFQVITRRTLFDLDKAQKRAHILQGYRIALENINRIIEMIRNSKDANQAKEQLTEKYAFTEIQAKSILDMRLQRLTGLEREKVEAEYEALEKLIVELQDILSHDSKIYDIMKKELLEVREVYGDNRRTHIEEERMEILPEDLIKDEEMIITCTNKGYIKRIEANKYKSQNRGGKGVSGLNTIDDDVVDNILTASNLDTLMIFTDKGKVYNIKVYQLPELSRQSRGRLISNILRIGEEEKIRAIIKTRVFDKEKELIFVTKQGIVKKTSLEEFKNINTGGLIAIKFKEDDDLIYVGLVEASDNEVFIATRRGFAVRFSNGNVRSTGRNTMGVKGIELREEDEVVSALLIKEKEMDILTITENGYGKRTKLDEYPSHNRGGKGVINLRCNEKTGNIVSVLSAFDEEELVCITSNGVIIRTPMNSISRFSRAAQGVIIMKVAADEKVASITRIKAEEKEEI
ncbi:MAG TPA: DNA gyrase C-terminal beta-propeller domain-containing protein, partial [Fusobacterium sp.]|uniref:DNA gyrase C-terminal beta-propeller domain-containing protein n=1 Tax=Fusobacterium sp. TaxID=68766 RepID=UPI002F40AF07